MSQIRNNSATEKSGAIFFEGNAPLAKSRKKDEQ